MSPRTAWLVVCMVLAVVCGRAQPAAEATAPRVIVIGINGAIGPATADHIVRALDRAAGERAQLVVLQMDTPGGLDTAMRTIVKAILASPTPVVGFVAPQGARAASAGTYILYAAHLAAMAPATNLGAATPIAIGLPTPGGGTPEEPAPGRASAPSTTADTMAAKRINDASAYIRGLAQLRGRDVAWAEQAVRESVSLPASEALTRKVIDVVAVDLNDLLRQLNGRVVHLGSGAAGDVTLATARAEVVHLQPDWRERLLAVISDPSLTLVLMMIGVYGLLFEFMNPGFVAPGVIGGVCLLLALWGLQMLPINYAGLALVGLGIAFFVAEAFVPSYGALGLGGIAAFAFGALLLVDGDAPGFSIPLPLIATLALVSAAFIVAIANMAARARKRPIVSGVPALLGAAGEIIEFDAGQGWALVDGERWRVRASESLRAGQRVTVNGVDGLVLAVSASDIDPTRQGAST